MRHDTLQFIFDAVLRGLSAAGMHLVVRSRADAGLGARNNGAAARRGLSGDRWDGTGCWRAPGASLAGHCAGPGVCGGDPAGRRIRPTGRATGFGAGTIRRDADTPEVREYMAIGVVNDEEIGEMSEIKEVVYAG